MVLRDFERSIARVLGEAIDVQVSVYEPAPFVMVDRSLLETALLNLCINARDAIGSSGRISISVTSGPSTQADFEKFGLRLIKPNQQYICLSVTDNGHGIEPDLIPRLTEPFFTTKVDGSGLGLSSVAGFVKQSGGGMHIRSTLGVGTSVQFLLPLGRPTKQQRPAQLPKTKWSTNNNVTILVVDDEPGVRQVAVRWFGRQGLQVISACSAAEALQRLQESHQQINVLFSDIVMPGEMDGIALAMHVSKHYPHIAIQLATGFDEIRRKARHDAHPFPVISKPYRLPELLVSIKNLLQARPQL